MMTNSYSASAKLADFLQSSHDDRVNWPAKLGALLQSCKPKKYKTDAYQLVTKKWRLQSSVLQSSCKAIKRITNNVLVEFMTTTHSPYLYR